MSRKPWTKEEEQVLRQMYEKDASITDIAEKLNKTVASVSLKVMRLNLKRPLSKDIVNITSLSDDEDDDETKIILNKSPPLEPKELITHEQVLKILSGALQRLQEGDLSNNEVKRLKILSNLAARYNLLLERFIRWDEIEKRLEAIEARLQEAASQGNT